MKKAYRSVTLVLVALMFLAVFCTGMAAGSEQESDDGMMFFGGSGTGGDAEATPELETGATPEPQTEAPPSLEASLAALNSGSYNAAYEYLQSGEVFASGAKGDGAKGFQQLLQDLGGDIAADGSVGSQTMAALNEIRANLSGAEPVEQVDTAIFEELIGYALLSHKTYDEALGMEDADRYAFAGLQTQVGNYYTAKKLYESMSGYLDSADRALACELDWPENGAEYDRHPDFTAKTCPVEVAGVSDEATGMYMKFYTLEEELVCGMFIKGGSSATISLPAGSYIVKEGEGSQWYGPNEAFGDGEDGNYAYYYRMSVYTDEGLTDVITLQSGYRYEIGGTTEGDGLSYDSEDFNNF